MKIHGYFQTNWISCKELYQMGVVVLYGNIRILTIEPNFYIGVTSGNVLNGFLWAEVLGIFTYICIYAPFIPSYSTQLYLFCLLFLTLEANCTQNILICTNYIQICNFIFVTNLILNLHSCWKFLILPTTQLNCHSDCNLSCFKS